MKFLDRLLKIGDLKSSCFIFGPRMVGKTSLLKRIDHRKYLDLLNPKEELRLRQNPEFFWEELQTLSPEDVVILDEIQKLPMLLDYVQMGIDQLQLRFLLSGSSARKLRRGGANLLGGRALDLKLHPLTSIELGKDFNLTTALSFGTLPKIYFFARSENQMEAKLLLQSYHTTYLKEEIQAEALVRNLTAFQRFLVVAASADARMVEYANIARDCGVPDSTVKEYFSILEDTLIGRLLWPWDRSVRKKARPKFYLFDPGVTRALLNRLNDPPTRRELGLLFESWFIQEIIRLKDYYNKPHEISFWREGDNEVDILIHNQNDFILAIEIKLGELVEDSLSSLNAFKAKYPSVPTIIASHDAKVARKTKQGHLVLPWKEVLEFYLDRRH